MATILAEYEKRGINPDYKPLSQKELASRPDIADINLEQLYEIKPWSALDQGMAEVTYYQQIFSKAKVPMKLGPMNDPATKGVLPTPGGYIIFYSPKPGIILYKKKNKETEPEPREYPEPVGFPVQMPITAPDGIAERPILPPLINPFPEFEPGPTTVWDWAYWEDVTGLTGAALVIYLIVSEGSRLFPPRNLVPIP